MLRRAMLGRMSRSSSRRPSLSSGTQTRGWRGTAETVPLSLKETLSCMNISLEEKEEMKAEGVELDGLFHPRTK
jgi:hypothetical protein